MIRLGLTGSIATGKSTVATMFQQQNIPVRSADDIVHDLYENDAVTVIGKLFPATVIAGKIDRAALAAITLHDAARLKSLEKAVHPLVGARMNEFCKRQEKSGTDLLVLEIPLLFEADWISLVDRVAVTFCAEALQTSRALQRPGMTAEKLAAIRSRQMPQTEKRNRADFEIDTGTSFGKTHEAVKRVIADCRTTATQKTGKYDDVSGRYRGNT